MGGRARVSTGDKDIRMNPNQLAQSAQPWLNDPVVQDEPKRPKWMDAPIVAPAQGRARPKWMDDPILHQGAGDTEPANRPPQIIEFEGQLHEFPGNFTQEQISKALKSYSRGAANKSSGSRPWENDPIVGQAEGPSATDFGSLGYDPILEGFYPEKEEADIQRLLDAVEPQPKEDDWRIPQIAAQAIGRGAGADLIGAPVDLMTLGLNAGASGLDWIAEQFGGNFDHRITDPVWGSDFWAKHAAIGAEDMGVDVIEPNEREGTEDLLYNVLRFGSGAASGGLGLASKASKADDLVRAAQPGGVVERLFSSAMDGLTAPYKTAPGKAIAADTAAGAGAGVGYNYAEDHFEDSPLAALGLTMLGGYAGGSAASTAQGITKAGSAINGTRTDKAIPPDAVPGTRISQNAAEEAAKRMQGIADDPEIAAQNVRRTMQEKGAEGMPLSTSGLEADDVGLAALDTAYRQRDPVPFIRQDNKLRDYASESVSDMRPESADPTQEVVRNFARDTAGQKTGAARAATEAAERDIFDMDEIARLLDGEADDLAAPVLAERGEQGAASRALDHQVTEGTLRPRAVENRRLTDAAGRTELKTEAGGLAQAADEVAQSIGSLSPGQRELIPAEFTSRLEGLLPKIRSVDTGVLDADGSPITRSRNMGGDGQIDVKSLLEVRPYLSTASDAAQRSGNFSLSGNIRRFSREVNAALDKVAASGVPGSEEVQAAQRYFREQYAPFFAEGRGAEFRDAIFRDSRSTPGDDMTRTRLAPSDVAAFFLDGPLEDKAHLARIASIAPSPQAAEEAITRFLTAQLATKMTDDGLNPAVLRKWLDNHKDSFRAFGDQFPGIEGRFRQLQQDVMANRGRRNSLMQDIEKRRVDLRAAEQTEASVKQALDASVLSTFIKNDPARAAGRILNDTQDPLARVREVNKMLDEAPEALRRQLREEWQATVVDHLYGKIKTARETAAGNDVLSYDQLSKALDRYDPLIREVFAGEPEKLNAMQRAKKVLMPLTRREGSAMAEPTSAEAAKQSWNTLEAGILAATGNAIQTGMIMRRIKVVMNLLPGSGSKVDRLVERAILDPNLFLHLIERNVPDRTIKTWNRKLIRLMGLAAAGRESGEGE